MYLFLFVCCFILFILSKCRLSLLFTHTFLLEELVVLTSEVEVFQRLVMIQIRKRQTKSISVH